MLKFLPHPLTPLQNEIPEIEGVDSENEGTDAENEGLENDGGVTINAYALPPD